MTYQTQYNIVRYSAPLPGSTQEESAEAQEKKTPTPLNNNEVYITGSTVSAAKGRSDAYQETIYGSGPVQPPGNSYTLNEREGRIDAYAARVRKQIKNIESGSEGERNVKFQNVRLFMEPTGYFSAGLLAAGFDPHEKITVKFNTYVGMGTGKNLSDSGSRTYYAWEIAAGALEHDTPARGGIVNFHDVETDMKDRSKIKDLQAFGKRLQNHWEHDIATPMRGSAEGKNAREVIQYLPTPIPFASFIPKQKVSTVIPERSGKADAYTARGTLQSLRSDKETFEKLSPEGQKAIGRTLDKNGQVIIPNIYGYPLSGYAFVPYTPYDGHTKHRPNQGVMIDLKSGAVREIKGDDEFATWAKNNRSELVSRFNASDLQGGKDAHWPSAAGVLDLLIQDNRSHFPGRKNLTRDKSVPVRELFNYTESRRGDYKLKFGDLNKGIASHYQEVNAKNALWADQTKVFGSVEQGWKSAKEVWGNTFGYVPVLGNAGNIIFGQHDAEHGMTASDRVGGTAGAVISGLLLAHELIPVGVEAGLGEAPLDFNASGTEHYNWRYNAQTSEFELARPPKSTTDIDTLSVTPKQAPEAISAPQAASFPEMREIELKGKTYFVAEKPDAGDGVNYLLRVRDPNDPSKLASSGIIANPDETGVWSRRGEAGGGWPWSSPKSPAASIEPKIPLLSDQFLEINGEKMKGATTLDKYLNTAEHEYTYGIAINDQGEQVPQVSWTVEENPANATPHPSAEKSTFGTSEYSEQFIKDINRSRFTVNTPGGVVLEIDIPKEVKLLELKKGAKLSTAELNSVIQKNIEKFEVAIPDPALRARISEVANQWLLGAAPDEFQTTRFKGTVFGSGRDPHYIISYNAKDSTMTVTAKSEFILTKLDEQNGELETLTDINVKASRSITIYGNPDIILNNKVVEPYVIGRSAPTRIEITPQQDS